jgi:hypothetical protein
LAIRRGGQIRNNHVARAQLGMKFFAGVGVTVHNDGSCYLRSESTHDCGTNTLGPAGDDDYLVFDMQVHCFLAINRANS